MLCPMVLSEEATFWHIRNLCFNLSGTHVLMYQPSIIHQPPVFFQLIINITPYYLLKKQRMGFPRVSRFSMTLSPDLSLHVPDFPTKRRHFSPFSQALMAADSRITSGCLGAGAAWCHVWFTGRMGFQEKSVVTMCKKTLLTTVFAVVFPLGEIKHVKHGLTSPSVKHTVQPCLIGAWILGFQTKTARQSHCAQGVHMGSLSSTPKQN